jgi:hypothetical protein
LTLQYPANWALCWQESESPETQYRFRGLWSPHIKVFLEIIAEEDKHDILVEVSTAAQGQHRGSADIV